MTVLILRHEDRLALRKRPDQGLLAGLWELPNLSGHLSGGEIRIWAVSRGLAPGSPEPAGERVHVFTHVEWHMRAWLVECGRRGEKLGWFTHRELERDVPVPTAFQAFLESAGGRRKNEKKI